MKTKGGPMRRCLDVVEDVKLVDGSETNADEMEIGDPLNPPSMNVYLQQLTCMDKVDKEKLSFLFTYKTTFSSYQNCRST